MKNNNEITNMKKNILLLLMPLLFFMAANAQAQEGCDEDFCCWDEDFYCVDETNFYTKILSGANFLQSNAVKGNKSTYQTGYLIAGSLGYCWRYGLRLEAEYAFRRNTAKKTHFFVEGFSKHGHLQTSSYMINLLWDLPPSLWKCGFWNIQPFVGVGVGYDLHQMHSSNSRIIFNQKWNHFSWQMMAGLAYPIFCNTEITLEYKLHQGGHQLHNHSVGVGLVYNFGYLRACSISFK